MSDHATAVLLVTPQGIPLVRDPYKPSPIYWKLPGGRSRPGETAEECAVREVAEETGISLSVGDLRVIYQESRISHTFTIFRGNLPALPEEILQTGVTGEDVSVFSPKDILDMQAFFPNHRRVVGRILETL